jgi:hypothetical protein
VVQREAALLGGGVGFDVYAGDEVGTGNTLDQEVEFLGTVYVYFFMERARQTCIGERRDIHTGLELVVESLKLELQLGRVRDGEALRRRDLAVMAWNGRGSGAVELHCSAATDSHARSISRRVSQCSVLVETGWSTGAATAPHTDKDP